MQFNITQTWAHFISRCPPGCPFGKQTSDTTFATSEQGQMKPSYSFGLSGLYGVISTYSRYFFSTDAISYSTEDRNLKFDLNKA